MIELLRLPDVLKARARRKTPHYHDIKRGLCTPPLLIGDRAVAWPAHEIEALNGARVAGRTDDEIRALVRRLVAARKTIDRPERGNAAAVPAKAAP